MKLKEVGGIGLGVLTLIAVAAIAMVIFRLELAMLYTLALILVGGVAFAVAAIGVAFALRAWKSSGPQERERVIERHTIEREGRMPAEPKIHLLDNRQQGGAGVFPDILRAAYMAGVRGLTDGQDDTEVIEGETRDLSEEWKGQIRE